MWKCPRLNILNGSSKKEEKGQSGREMVSVCVCQCLCGRTEAAWAGMSSSTLRERAWLRSSPGHIFMGIPLASCKLVDGAKLMWFDGAAAPTLSPTNTALVPASLRQHAHRNEKYIDTQLVSIQTETEKQTNMLMSSSFSSSSPTAQQQHKYPLSHKPLKGTGWILIRSGVVSSAQHGLQWD